MLRPNVLVGCDFSDSSNEAIRWADAWANATSTGLVVCHVLPEALHFNPLFPQEAGPDTKQFVGLEKRVLEALEERVVELTGRQLGQFDVNVQDGSPSTQLVRQADELKTSLLVVGSKGQSSITRMPLGSEAKRVVRFAGVPVAVVRPTKRSGRVLAATDFSDPAIPAIITAANEAKRRGAKLTVMHCLELGSSIAAGLSGAFGGTSARPQEPWLERARENAGELLGSILTQNGIEADRLIDVGDAAVAIIRVAERLEVELIVVGTHGRTGLGRLLLGSVAEKVVTLAHGPVMVVRLEPI